ncbi:MAG: hypothetical protein FWF59_04065 [Turicibacter sp.]|nr:hypothetical protein [Turicibacter sp.]
MGYNIWVYAICKDEEKFVDQWMASMGEADGVLVLDTGSTDHTVQKLRGLGAKVVEKTYDPWRFDHARNDALMLLGDDVDICVSTDLDEVLVPGWRALLEEQWQPCTNRGHFLYNYSLDENGNPTRQFQREKIHSRHGYIWANPVHECLKYTGDGPEQDLFLKGVVLNHYPDTVKSRFQYLPLLELSAAENPQDDRTVFWLGREYYFNYHYDEAIKTLKGHLQLPGAKWGEERSASMAYIGKSYMGKGDQKSARQWFLRAVAESPMTRESYLSLVRFGYAIKDWALVYAYCKEALKIPFPSTSYLAEPECFGHAFYDYGSIAAYHLGLMPEALVLARQALSKKPGDLRLENNVSLAINAVAQQFREAGDANG